MENDKNPATRNHLSDDQLLQPEILHMTSLEVDELYNLLENVIVALDDLKIDYVMVGGSLLGAVRSESILFNDDEVALAIVDEKNAYEEVKQNLPAALAHAAERRQERENISIVYQCEWRSWQGCDWITSSLAPGVRLNLFVLRKFESWNELLTTILRTADQLPASVRDIETDEYPLYHYDNNQAIDLYPNEYFTERELFPLKRLTFGHLKVRGPRDSIGTLRRFFGSDCFASYSVDTDGKRMEPGERRWRGQQQKLLSDNQFRPIQHSSKRIWTDHSRKTLEYSLAEYDDEIQTLQQQQQQQQSQVTTSPLSDEKQQSSGQMSRTRSLFTIKPLSAGRESSYKQLSPASASSVADRATEPTPTKWFGKDVRAFLNDNPEAPEFNHSLRAVIEPHIAKARKKREEFRNPLEVEVDDSLANAVGVPYTSLRDERRFLFDEHTYPIHRVLAETLGVEDLSMIHEHHIKDKRTLLQPLLNREKRRAFHECYDNFVTSFCIPLLHSLAIPKNIFHTTSPNASSKIVYRYQAFPCIRVIRPGEFSIGPHCDIAYGHSVGNLNFHIPLTPTLGTGALYTESHPGREDWHPLTTKSVGLAYLFDGARCIHFSLENTTEVTRVSLDFRVAIYRKRHTTAPFDGGLCTKPILEDRFWREGIGYYDEAIIDLAVGPMPFSGHTVAKKVSNRLFDPDARVGFPFTQKE